MTQQLTIVHANLHNEVKAIRAAAALGADVFGYNEASRRAPMLATWAKTKGYRLHTAQPVTVPYLPARRGPLRNVSQDTATLVTKRYAYLGEMQQQVSQQVDPVSRVAPDRWFTLAAFAVGSTRVAHVNLHPNAGPDALRRADSAITREYAESMTWLDGMLELYRRMGYALLVSGDLNMRDEAKDRAWSPYPVLKSHGMVWHDHGIDAVAWSRKHFELRNATVIPKAKVFSDHDALRVTLNLR